MQMESHIKARIARNSLLSLLLYALPVILMFAALALTGSHPWEHMQAATQAASHHDRPWAWLQLDRWGLTIFTLALGIVEFAFGLYDEHWTKNERALDIACFVLPKIVISPTVAYFSLKFLPLLIPDLHNAFVWVPFFLGLLHHRRQ